MKKGLITSILALTFGSLTQMAKDTEVIVVDSAESTMLGRLKAKVRRIPQILQKERLCLQKRRIRFIILS